MNIFIFIIIFFVSYAGVEIFRRWSLRKNLFDVPNERSSHTIPTVRGGGSIIVLISLVSYSFYNLYAGNNFQIGYLLGAGLIALISWLDDLYTISFVWRLLIHSISAILVVLTLGYFQEIYIPFTPVVNIGVFGYALTFVWIVWLTNAYNFMDGIDGIAGMQALTAGIGWLVIGAILGFKSAGFYGGVLAFSSLGFLIQNWQPAKIFMGDVGSAFLGFSFAVLPLLAKNELAESADANKYLPVVALLLVWLFVFDTVYTFIRRSLRGEKVWEAHRGHLYQQMNISGLSHHYITCLYGFFSVLTIGFTIFWLYKKESREIILILSIVLQSIGLLIYNQIRRKRRVELKI